jgi:demethylphylloquinone reductase
MCSSASNSVALIFRQCCRLGEKIVLAFITMLAVQFCMVNVALNSVTAFPLPSFLQFKGRQQSINLSSRTAQMSYESSKDHTICVVGGGFGGLYTALSVSKQVKDNVKIYLVDPKDRFVFLPLLYELAMGSADAVEVAPKYADLLAGSKIQFIQGMVDNIDFQQKTCHIHKVHGSPNEASMQMHFDQLVLAAGSQSKLDYIPGAKQYSIPFYGIQDCFLLRKKVEELKKHQKQGYVRVVIIGGGYSGVELATNLADYFGRHRIAIRVVDRNQKIMQASSEYNRDVAER